MIAVVNRLPVRSTRVDLRTDTAAEVRAATLGVDRVDPGAVSFGRAPAVSLQEELDRVGACCRRDRRAERPGGLGRHDALRDRQSEHRRGRLRRRRRERAARPMRLVKVVSSISVQLVITQAWTCRAASRFDPSTTVWWQP